MKTNKNLPVLERQCVAGTTWRYCVQKIVQYDDGKFEPYSEYIGAWNSDTGDIDRAMEDIYRREKEFCDNNKYVKPFTFTLRKVAIECKMEVIDEMKDHFGKDDYKTLCCAECGCAIQYGDDFLTDKDTGKIYCCSDCFVKSHNVIQHEMNNDDYRKYFGLEK